MVVVDKLGRGGRYNFMVVTGKFEGEGGTILWWLWISWEGYVSL